MIKRISELGVLPVVKIDKEEDAPLLAKALVKGDLPAAEVTFRTKAAKKAIALMKEAEPDMLVGAGTVLSIEQVNDALEAGAEFMVSPGFNPKVVGYCMDKNIPIFPGVNNPTGIEQALEFGLKTVKFFPAESSGGLDMLKAMSAPYGAINFMPTGGIGVKNIGKYLAFDKIVACGGSWMVPSDAINNKDFDKITALTKEAVMTVLGFEFGHLGINNADKSAALNVCDTLSSLFGYSCTRTIEMASFMGDDFEIMYNTDKNEHGHMSFLVNSLERALAFLKRKGVSAVADTVKYNEKGKPVFAYLDVKLAGFGIHLAQK